MMTKDLGIKIGTKTQQIWEAVKKNTTQSIENIERELIIQKAIIELAEQKIAQEIEKLK